MKFRLTTERGAVKNFHREDGAGQGESQAGGAQPCSCGRAAGRSEHLRIPDFGKV